MNQVNPVLLNQLKADYQAMKAVGSPLLACQGMLVPRGYPSGRLLIKNMPYPVVSNNDPAQIDIAGGLQMSVAGVPKTSYDGSITMIETEAGHARNFGEYIVARGGSIDCDLYIGRVTKFTRVIELIDCKIRLEAGELDASSRSNGLDITGSITYMFFGNFANIGQSNTVLPGEQGVEGAQELIERVQNVLNASSNVLGGVSGLLGAGAALGSAIGGLLG